LSSGPSFDPGFPASVGSAYHDPSISGPRLGPGFCATTLLAAIAGVFAVTLPGATFLSTGITAVVACPELVEEVEGLPAPFAASPSAQPANPATITANATTLKILRLTAFMQAISLETILLRNP